MTTDGCCRHNSHDDTTDKTVTTRLADHRPSHQLRESYHAASRITQCLSSEIKRRTNLQYTSFTNECLRDLHTSFTREDDVCSHWQLCLNWLNQTPLPDIACPAQGHLPTDRHIHGTSEAWLAATDHTIISASWTKKPKRKVTLRQLINEGHNGRAIATSCRINDVREPAKAIKRQR